MKKLTIISFNNAYVYCVDGVSMSPYDLKSVKINNKWFDTKIKIKDNFIDLRITTKDNLGYIISRSLFKIQQKHNIFVAPVLKRA